MINFYRFSVEEFPERYYNQVRYGYYWDKPKADGKTGAETYAELLGAKTKEDVERIMGNRSAFTYYCDCCSNRYEEIVYLATEGGDSSVALCQGCIEKASGLFKCKKK